MRYLPVICFALIPFGFCGLNIFYAHANMFLLAATLMLFCCKAANDYPVNDVIKLFGGYLGGWIACSYLMAFLNLTQLSSLFLTVNESVMFYMAAMVFFITVYRGDVSFDTWADVICGVAVAEASLAIVQWYGLDPFAMFLGIFVELVSQAGQNIPTGTLGNPNFLAAFLAISFPLFLRKSKWFFYNITIPRGWCLLLPVIVFALLLSKTTAAIGALIVGMAFFYGGLKYAGLSLIPAFIIYAIKYQGTVFTNARWEYWRNAWESTSSTWHTLLFGWGPGITWQPGNMLHSEYVNMFFNFGIVGVLFLVAYLICTVRGSANRYLQTAVVIIAINIIGNHAFHLVSTGVLAIVIFALIEREKRQI